MTNEEYAALRTGDKVQANSVDWNGDWPGCIIIVFRDAQDRLSFKREKDAYPCSPGAKHIELYRKAKVVPLPLPG